MELHFTTKGKIAESLVPAKLLEVGLEVFESTAEISPVVVFML